MGFPVRILHIVHFHTAGTQTDTAVDTALTAMVMLVVGVEDVDFVPQESSLFVTVTSVFSSLSFSNSLRRNACFAISTASALVPTSL